MGSDKTKANAASGLQANSSAKPKSDRPKSDGHTGQQANQSAPGGQRQMGDHSDAKAGAPDRALDKPKS